MNHQRLLRVAISLTLLTLLLSACSALQPQPTLAPTPTPDMTPGQVRGTLLDANQQPVRGVRLGLLRTVRSGGDAQGEVKGGMEVKHYVTLDGVFVQVVDAGVVATTDISGVFSFEDVPPGEYLPYVMSSQDKFKDAIGETLVFTLLPGQVVDLTIQKQ